LRASVVELCTLSAWERKVDGVAAAKGECNVQKLCGCELISIFEASKSKNPQPRPIATVGLTAHRAAVRQTLQPRVQATSHQLKTWRPRHTLITLIHLNACKIEFSLAYFTFGFMNSLHCPDDPALCETISDSGSNFATP
jgi:hypothetical protein